jgi:hypothetical protein
MIPVQTEELHPKGYPAWKLHPVMALHIDHYSPQKWLHRIARVSYHRRECEATARERFRGVGRRGAMATSLGNALLRGHVLCVASCQFRYSCLGFVIRSYICS